MRLVPTGVHTCNAQLCDNDKKTPRLNMCAHYTIVQPNGLCDQQKDCALRWMDPRSTTL